MARQNGDLMPTIFQKFRFRHLGVMRPLIHAVEKTISYLFGSGAPSIPCHMGDSHQGRRQFLFFQL